MNTETVRFKDIKPGDEFHHNEYNKPLVKLQPDIAEFNAVSQDFGSGILFADDALVEVRTEEGPEAVGGFDLGDYITAASNTDYDLTEDQVKEAMEYSRTKLLDASIGLDWDILELHIEMWVDKYYKKVN